MRKNNWLAEKIEQYFGPILVLFSLGLLCYLLASSLGAFGTISDFPEYYAPAKMCLNGQGGAAYVINLLGQEQHKIFPMMGERVVLLFVPPPGLMLAIWLGLFNPLTAEIIWKGLLVACLVGTIVIMAKMFSLKNKATCYLVTAMCLSQACYEVLRIDQLAPILLFSLTAAIYFLKKKQDIKAGLFLSLFILKPQLILVYLAYLAGMRRWRPLLTMIIVVSVLTVLAYFVIGSVGFKNYFDLLRLPTIAHFMQPELMPTLRGQLLKILPDDASVIMKLSIIVYGIVVAGAYLLGAKYRQAAHAIELGILLVMPLGLITALHCHSYDLLLLLPSLLILFNDTAIKFGPYFKLLVIAGSIVFVLPLSTMIHYDYLLRGGKCNIWFVELLILSAMIFKISMRQKPNSEVEIVTQVK